MPVNLWFYTPEPSAKMNYPSEFVKIGSGVAEIPYNISIRPINVIRLDASHLQVSPKSGHKDTNRTI